MKQWCMNHIAKEIQSIKASKDYSSLDLAVARFGAARMMAAKFGLSVKVNRDADNYPLFVEEE